MIKTCLSCAKQLVRRPEEHNTNFLRRRHCNRSCGCAVGRTTRGQTRPKREVPCTVCGAPLLRSVHFSDAKCHGCVKAHQRRAENAAHAKLNESARKYRILLHALGWAEEDHDDLLEYLRSVPWAYPDGRQIRDLRRVG